MSRQQPKFPTNEDLKKFENRRSRERLDRLTDEFNGPSPERSAPVDSDTLDTRRIPVTRSGPLSNRLRSQVPIPSIPQKFVTEINASLLFLDGSEFVSLPCDEESGQMVLGRGKTAVFKVSDPYVHRIHSHLRWDPTARIHVIAHAGGENGTYVNKKRIREPTALYSGARVRVGKSEFIYRLH